MKSSVYQRPDKPATVTVTRRREVPSRAPLALPEILAVDRTTECHVTPPTIAAEMVSALEPVSNARTLEPSVGTGNLLRALFDQGQHADTVVAIERSVALCEALQHRFTNDETIHPIQGCFLDYAQRNQGCEGFSRILMNGPFRHIRRHMNAALSLLDRGAQANAVLVALVPITWQHEQAQTLVELPRDTFSTAAVHTKIIRIKR